MPTIPIKTPGMKQKVQVIDTGMFYGPCKLLLGIPDRADLAPIAEMVKDFQRDFGEMMVRSSIPNLSDVFEVSQGIRA